MTAYFGISRNLSKGDYKLKIYAKYNTKTISKIIPISLQSTPFPVIRLSFPKKKKKIVKNKTQLSSEASVLAKKFRIYTDKKYFKQPFIKPVIGRVSSDLDFIGYMKIIRQVLVIPELILQINETLRLFLQIQEKLFFLKI